MSDVDNVYRLDPATPDGTVDSVACVGGKAANLAELTGAGFPVPEGFVVTADAYRRFVERAGLEEDLGSVLDVDSSDPDAVTTAGERARALISEASLPADLRGDIRAAYRNLSADRVAVRSSATAEDLPEASFAGQQDSFLNVEGPDAVLERVRDCWASLFTDRALTYRTEQGFDLREVAIAVVVQAMVDAEKSGVLFTADPTTGECRMTVEAAWGLGEGVVSGAVSPDNYVIDPEAGEVISVTVNDKRVRFDRDPDTGDTVERPVAPGRREQQVLTDAELHELADLGERVEAHYGSPQDIEWAINDGDLVVLQARPITTIKEDGVPSSSDVAADGSALAGLGASDGVAEGRLCLDPLEAVKYERQGEPVVLVRKMTSPSDLHGMKAADAILTSQGGTTSHAAIVARELDTPAVVGCDALTVDYDAGEVRVDDGRVIRPGDVIQVDGDAGQVTLPE